MSCGKRDSTLPLDALTDGRVRRKRIAKAIEGTIRRDWRTIGTDH